MSAPTIFTIHSSRHGEIVETHRISPFVAVAKARRLHELGWRVCITDRIGRHFKLPDFDMLLDCYQSASLSLSLHQAW
jgi:hypothetical protein